MSLALVGRTQSRRSFSPSVHPAAGVRPTPSPTQSPRPHPVPTLRAATGPVDATGGTEDDLRGPCWSRLRLVGETDFSARESCGQGGQKSARLGPQNPRAGGRRGMDGVPGRDIPPHRIPYALAARAYLNNSALEKYVLVLASAPPAISTDPSGKSVAVWSYLVGKFMGFVVENAPRTGL